jgi:RNA polymerase sigma-70 factor (ECF subfamily)
MNLSDEELVARSLKGSRWANEVIYRRYASSITGLSARLLGSASEAEDLCQDTFIIAFRDLKNLRNPAALRSWLVGIAVHRAHKLFRRRKLRRRLGLVSMDPSLHELLVRPVTDDLFDAMNKLSKALDGASPMQRTCWWLRHGEGYSLQEVADAHDCSLATAKRRIAEVNGRMSKLHAAIEAQLEELR